MARTSPYIVSTRLNRAAHERVRRLAAKRGWTVAYLVRHALADALDLRRRTLSVETADQIRAFFDEIADAIELPKGTEIPVIVAKIKELAAELEAPPGDAAGEGAEAPPPAALDARTLTPGEVARARGMRPEQAKRYAELRVQRRLDALQRGYR